MKNNFSKRVQMVIQYAREEALRLGHNYIGAEHLLLGILREGDGMAVDILSGLGVDLDELKATMEDAVKTSGGTITLGNLPLTKRAEKILKSTYLEAKNFKSDVIGTEHLLLSISKEADSIAAEVLASMGVDYDSVSAELANILEGATRGTEPRKRSKTPALDHFGRDITELARRGELDPVIGREKEIERVAQILSRRKKNNPVLIGEPGVGKTAIAEGLGLRIVEKQVPRVLYNRRIVNLDLASMVAGTKYRGQFEERMKAVMNELEKDRDIILFIDELHTIVGAGGASGSLDASNMFKPALARGEIQCIGATTLEEYRKYIERDGALERRFQKIIVNPSTVEESIAILEGLRSRYEAHHRVKYTKGAIEAAVKLSHRYITDKCLPDKAIDAMDETGARVRLMNIVVPEKIVRLEKELDELRAKKEAVVKSQKFEAAAKLRDKERKLSDQLRRARIAWEKSEEKEHIEVDEAKIAEVVSSMTGIPINKVGRSEIEKLHRMEAELRKHLVGQNQAIATLTRALRRARAGLKDPRHPIGSFIFLGPTGVGKTELARVLARYLFEDDESLIRLDMSEYMEKFNVSRLVGAPPGYVGYDQGGELTERVRRRPYSVVLLDEIEKAHYDVFNILLQVFDDGSLTDAYGRRVDFRNTIVIMTSNIGARRLKSKSFGFGPEDVRSRYEAIKTKVLEETKRLFNPEFLNRIDETIVFRELERKHMLKIVDLLIEEVQERMKERHFRIELTRGAKGYLVEKAFDPELGARPLARTVQKEIEDPIAEKILDGEFADGDCIRVQITQGKLNFVRSREAPKRRRDVVGVGTGEQAPSAEGDAG